MARSVEPAENDSSHRSGWSALSLAQRHLLSSWLPDLEIEEDMSWGLVDTTVLRAHTAAGQVVIKAAGPNNHHIAREIRAHFQWTEPWVQRGCAARLLHADEAANLLVTTYLPGRLVRDDPSAALMDTYVQAGELLRDFHCQFSEQDAEYEARKNAQSLKWLASPHRVHGESADRLAAQEFLWHPGSEEAFLCGYGTDPREPDAWFRQRVRAAIGTSAWAFQVGDQDFEAQGHRMIRDVLSEAEA